MDGETEVFEVMGFGRPDESIARFATREAATAHAAGLGHGTRRVRHPAGSDIVVVDEDGRVAVVRDVTSPDQMEGLIQQLCNLGECASFPAAIFERLFGGTFPYEHHPRRGSELGIFPWSWGHGAAPYEDLAERELMVLIAYNLRELFAYWTIVEGPVTEDGRDVQRLFEHTLALSRLRLALTPEKFDNLFGGLVEEREERTVRLVRELYEQEGLPVPCGLPDPAASEPVVVCPSA